MTHLPINERLLCEVAGLSYDNVTKVGKLQPSYGCVHGPGIVELFQLIDAGVERIEVASDGSHRPRVYKRSGSKWDLIELPVPPRDEPITFKMWEWLERERPKAFELLRGLDKCGVTESSERVCWHFPVLRDVPLKELLEAGFDRSVGSDVPVIVLDKPAANLLRHS